MTLVHLLRAHLHKPVLTQKLDQGTDLPLKTSPLRIKTASQWKLTGVRGPRMTSSKSGIDLCQTEVFMQAWSEKVEEKKVD